MFAALGDYGDCAEVLLKQGGCDPAAKDRSGRTAAHWAAHHGHAQCLKVIFWFFVFFVSSNFSCITIKVILSTKKHFGSKPLSWLEPDQGGVTMLHLATRFV